MAYSDYLCAEMRRQLHCRDTHTARRTGHQNLLPGADPGDTFHSRDRSQCPPDNRSSTLQGDVFGYACQPGWGYRHIVGMEEGAAKDTRTRTSLPVASGFGSSTCEAVGAELPLGNG